MVICLEQGADLHVAQWIPLPLTVSCVSEIQIGFTFLVPAHPGSPGQRAVKRMCVCVHVVQEYLLVIGLHVYITHCLLCQCSLQCFDAVGWAAGRASGL